jgi:undecaprenyl-diphosphatase
MDWRIYHAIYSLSLRHHWLGTIFSDVEAASIPFMVVVTAALWLLARPGGSRKWKLAAGSGFGAAAVALLVNQVIHSIWDRPRPYEAHVIAHPWSKSTDASFPSDHASASLAIAFAVVVFDPLAGAVLLTAAVLIAVGRLFIGAHYPGDIGASVLVAVAAALLVVKLGRPVILFLVRLVERLTDPVLSRVWRARPRGAAVPPARP